MKTIQTFISLREIHKFYKDACKEDERGFSKEEFEAFIRCCERDFHQWLRDNLNYFEINELEKV